MVKKLKQDCTVWVLGLSQEHRFDSQLSFNFIFFGKLVKNQKMSSKLFKAVKFW